MPQTLKERVEKLEKSLDERDKKAAWANIAGTVLVPLAIGVAGLLVSNAISAKEQEIAEVNAKVQQVDVVTKLLDALISDNRPKRQLAIKAVLIALPLEGPELVRDIARTDPDTSVRQYASTTLQDRSSTLITDLFAGSPDVRMAAAAYIVSGWSSNPNIVPRLIQYSDEHWENDNGVYNTVVVLAGLSPSALSPHSTLVREFLVRAEQKGRKTAAQVRRVESLLPKDEL